jgi:hypothetical protein
MRVIARTVVKKKKHEIARLKISLPKIILLSSILLFSSCTSFQTGLYRMLIDQNNGDVILQSEPFVKIFLDNILDSFEDYSIKVFVRTPVNFQTRRNALMTHSYYVLIFKDDEYYTLSFYGTAMTFHSEGAWVLNANSDMTSYRTYLEGGNRWDVKELFVDEVVNVRQTIINIISKINSDVTYYYRDHIDDRSNMDNCNTALLETIVFHERTKETTVWEPVYLNHGSF